MIIRQLSFSMAFIVLCLCSGCEPRDDSTSPATAPDTRSQTIDDLERETQDALQRTQEVAEDTFEVARQKKDEYVASLRPKLEEADAYIQELELKLAEEGTQMRAELSAALEQLKLKRQAYQDEIDMVESAAEDAWETLKAGASAAADDLSGAMQNARELFKDPEA